MLLEENSVEIIRYMGFLLLDYAAMVLYADKARRYFEDVFEVKRVGRTAFLPAAALILLWMIVFSCLPVMVVYIFLYSALLLYFLMSRSNSLETSLFAGGTFLFHVANLYMMLFGVFSMLCGIETMESFRGHYFYLVFVFLVILASTAGLEIFNRLIDQEAIQILVNNKRQLRFAAMSLMFIDIYLLILSSVYDSSTYTWTILLFLIITSFLLFGAFYTAFVHAVRMSVLELYESRFKDLESQLEQSNRSIGKLKDEVYTDVLTGVSSRRYGLMRLERMVEGMENISVCLVDLDGLKEVNDKLGHQEGDRYLVGVAHVLREKFGVRYVCRLGGDEFLVVMPGINELEAETQIEEGAKRIADMFRRQNLPVHPSISYGIVETGKIPFASVSDILELADRKMYEMKKERHRMRQ